MVELSGRSSRRELLRRVGVGGVAAGLLTTGFGFSDGSAKAADLPEIVLQWVGAWESDDPPRNLARLYAADGTYGDISANANMTGADDIESFLRAMFAAANGFQRYLRTAIADGTYAFAEQQFTAMAPDGYNFLFQIYAVTLFKYEDTSILWSSDYYDSGSILMQLGAIPTAPWFNAPNSTDSVGRFCAKSG